MDFLLPLFDWLSGLLTQSPLVVIGGAFIWGILSVVLSPCHLSSIPLAVGYINGQGQLLPRRAFLLLVLFAAGILVSLAVVGLITSLGGRMLGDLGKLTSVILGIVFILTGFLLFDLIPLPNLSFLRVGLKQRGLGGAFVLGFLFGAATGPCTFGFIMPLLATAFQVATSNFAYAVLIVLSFALGHSTVIVFAGSFVNLIQRFLKWGEKSQGLVWLRRICGVLVIGSGIYLIVV